MDNPLVCSIVILGNLVQTITGAALKTPKKLSSGLPERGTGL